MRLTFVEDAWDEYLEWQRRDGKSVKKINDLLEDICRHPFQGLGKPEPLKGDKSGKWSRRINGSDRIVYRVEQETVIVFQCRGHYDR
ncbi:MAG: Txe/YoeB family addiction module toxin [Oscillospiraceae bacterium]|nr:Txe/YoeB family addiction module toxin [Oscillospiraceae bacterium]